MAEKGLSIRTVTILSMAVAAWVGWGIAATEYRTFSEEWNATESAFSTTSEIVAPARVHVMAAFVGGLYDFIVNSVTQIPSVFSVASHTLKFKPWLPFVVAGVMGLIAFGGVKLKSLEQSLEKSKRRR